jgi:hypothetical protein
LLEIPDDAFDPGAREGRSHLSTANQRAHLRPSHGALLHDYPPVVPVAPVMSIIVWSPPGTYSLFIQSVTKPRSPARMTCGALPHPQPWRSP